MRSAEPQPQHLHWPSRKPSQPPEQGPHFCSVSAPASSPGPSLHLSPDYRGRRGCCLVSPAFPNLGNPSLNLQHGLAWLRDCREHGFPEQGLSGHLSTLVSKLRPREKPARVLRSRWGALEARGGLPMFPGGRKRV